MYGRAKFDLLRQRVLSCEKDSQDGKAGGDHKQPREHVKKLRLTSGHKSEAMRVKQVQILHQLQRHCFLLGAC
jgi:hypothetical protein